jgi:23S rRNA (pseudouridine1915-N3)-methyltransferase
MRVPIAPIPYLLISSYTASNMHVKIITVGSKPPKTVDSLISSYEKRLPASIKVTWHYLKHGAASDIATSKQQESESILKSLPGYGRVILLDERGEQMDNQKLAKTLFNTSENIAIIIGGAHGVNEEVMNRADITLSLSMLVFPHQLVRLVLTEQIYRSYAISTNHPYHHS